MQKNFTIRAFIDLTVGDEQILLHDCYVASSVSTDLSGQTATLRFRREHQWPGRGALPAELTLICSGNLRLMFNDLVTMHGAAEPSVTIGYYDNACKWNELLDEDAAAAQGFEGLHIDFSSGLVLRIRADVAEVTT